MPVRRRVGRPRTRRGKGLLDWIKKAHNYVKSNKIISRFAPSILGKIGVSQPVIDKVAGISKTLGYGKKRRRVRRRRVGGRRRVIAL